MPSCQPLRSAQTFSVVFEPRTGNCLSPFWWNTNGKTNRGPNVSVESSRLAEVERVVNCYYAVLRQSVKCVLAVFGSMALKGRTKPLSVILETPSGYGKTAVVQMTFPLPCGELNPYVYRSDKFTPKAFVSHAANISDANLRNQDLLPKLENKVLVTKELAPIFRGRKEELLDNFSILISVLDGKGFTSDSGMRGQRGYQQPIIFNWIGATTPLPPETHRLMSQLGTRLLFYEVPAIEPTEEEIICYAGRDDSSRAETECQAAVNSFLVEFYRQHPIGTVSPETLVMPEHLLRQLVRWSRLLLKGRADVKYEKAETDWRPVSAAKPEGPWKVVTYFKELARGHALIHGRTEVNETDLEMVGHVALSSIPGHIRPIVRELRRADSVSSAQVEPLCGVSRPTARKLLAELDLLGLAVLEPGGPRSNKPDSVSLANEFNWLRQP